MTKIGDLLDEFREKPGKGGEPPVLTLTERNGFVRQADRFKKRLATEDVTNYRVVRRNDIAFNPYLLWAGAIAQNTIVDEGIISPLYPTFRVREGNDPRYVARLLLTPQLIGAYDGISFGSVPRRRRSSVRDFLNLPLASVPPLHKQRRIAAILDHADAVRAKRRQILAQLDALTQSIFYDMFGDPDAVNKNIQFGDVASLSGGRNLVGDDPAADSQYRVLKISAVTTGRFKPHESKPLPPDYVPPMDHLVRPGDLLMSRANTTELVGAVALVSTTPPNLALPDKVWRFDWKTDAEPVFWHALMGTATVRRRISRLASGTGGSMKNISKAKLELMPLPRIEMDQQLKFADRSSRVELNRVLVERALAAEDALFLSLQTRAFRNELG